MNPSLGARCRVAVLVTAWLAGCNRSADQPTPPEVPTANAGHDHSGWWCPEHGVPEEVCALCNARLADQFKAKGDWCNEHDRPDSQCFLCHPEREAEFAALYEAKYGEPPPKPTPHHDDQHHHEHEHEQS